MRQVQAEGGLDELSFQEQTERNRSHPTSDDLGDFFDPPRSGSYVSYGIVGMKNRMNDHARIRGDGKGGGADIRISQQSV